MAMQCAELNKTQRIYSSAEPLAQLNDLTMRERWRETHIRMSC